MGHFPWKVHQLRGFFIIYILGTFAIEMFLGWRVARDALEEGDLWGIHNFFIPPGFLLMLIVFFTGIILALGLWVFSKLLLRKNWARILLLVVGWLADMVGLRTAFAWSAIIALTSLPVIYFLPRDA